MTNQVAMRSGYVYLDGVEFRLDGPISPILTSSPPPKVVIGENVQKTDGILNELIHRDGSLGIGLSELTDPAQANYNWFGRLLSYRGARSLPEEVVEMGAPSGLASPGLEGMFDFGNTLYGIWNNNSRLWDDTTKTWGSAIKNVGTPNSIVNVWYSNAEYVFVANTSTLWRINDPTLAGGYTDLAVAAKWLIWWDNKLIRVLSDGSGFASTDNGATWGAKTLTAVPIQSSYIQKIVLYSDAAGDAQVYACTKKGVFILDYTAGAWKATRMANLPPHQSGGKGNAEWRGDLYHTAGLDILRYTVAETATVSDNASLNRLHGLPAEMRGEIVNSQPSLNELYVLLDASQAGTVTAYYGGGAWRGSGGYFATPAVPQSTGYTAILAYNGVAWRVLWRSSGLGTSGTVLHMSQSNSQQRLIWGTGGSAYYSEISRALRNPIINPVQRFQLGPLDDCTPWFDAFSAGRNGLAVIAFVRVRNVAAGRPVTLEYALDKIETWYPVRDPSTGVAANTFTTDGLYERAFESALAGQVFDFIRFRVTLQTNDATKSPVVDYLGMYYAIVPKQRWGYTIKIAIEGATSAGTPKQQTTALRNVLPDNDSEPKLVTLQYHDDTTDLDQFKHVLVYRMMGTEYAGTDYRAKYMLTCAQVWP